jgi:hypothetical protein
MAVYAVMIDHSGGNQTAEENIAWSLQWTQQFLMLISGMAFMLSRSDFLPYAGRLLILTAVGMVANWLGFFIAGGPRHQPGMMCMTSHCAKMQDPAHDQGVKERDAFSVFWRDPNDDPSCAPDCQPDYSFSDINYQMGYTLMLILNAAVCLPIKHAMKWRNDNPREHATKQVQRTCALYGCVFMLQLVAYVADPTESKFYSPSGYTLSFLQLFVISLVCVYPINDGHGEESHVGWICMAVMYLPRIAGDVKFKPGHWVDMFILGVIVMVWPLTGQKRILNVFKCYWPLLAAALMQAKEQSQHGRCDLSVPHYWFERLRFNFCEAWLVIAFVVGAFKCSDPYLISRWLNWWSIYGFCFHRMWYQILPIPYGHLFTTSHVFFFYLLARKYPPKTGGALGRTGSADGPGGLSEGLSQPTTIDLFSQPSMGRSMDYADGTPAPAPSSPEDAEDAQASSNPVAGELGGAPR